MWEPGDEVPSQPNTAGRGKSGRSQRGLAGMVAPEIFAVVSRKVGGVGRRRHSGPAGVQAKVVRHPRLGLVLCDLFKSPRSSDNSQGRAEGTDVLRQSTRVWNRHFDLEEGTCQVHGPAVGATVVGMQAEERFAHLLQPIRDLAANWNVKIATELDEYLVR